MLRKNNNLLLKKDDVGMPKAATRDLPQFGHSYGLPGARDPEGVGKCKYQFTPPLSNHFTIIIVTTIWTAHRDS
tara:strand:- start:539 stop:760 length:222 start_codon:yes stop_codon:yes gene_type:complete